MSSELESTVIDKQEDGLKDKYLHFQLGKEEYGLQIRYVTEIMGMQKITFLPGLPIFVKGVINLRGKVIPVIDVRLRFGLEERAYGERTCIIVADLNNVAVGLIVDSVKEVLDIPENQIEAPPKIKQAATSRYIQGLGKVGEQVLILLDVEKLLFEDELRLISESAA